MTTLSPDLPKQNLEDDLFGHAPFAEHLAKSILKHNTSDGLVIALHGPWGSGKTTVLNYVRQYIENEGRAGAKTPAIVEFNPWWFSGREQIAKAFFDQLMVALPKQNKKFKDVAELIGNYAEGLGTLADLTGYTFGLGRPLGGLFKSASRNKPKNIPLLKKQIRDVLEKEQAQILVVIDDIDRLEEYDVCQLFTVIKALADFPYIIYLLAFDREVAETAVQKNSNLPGERYLEKIIQVPFEIPYISSDALENMLTSELNKLVLDTPNELFNHDYWAFVFLSGIKPLIHVPRDVVRFINTLHVTYEPIRKEVNAVDFIAIEAIRIFIPKLYDIIRSNQKFLTRDESFQQLVSLENYKKIFDELVSKEVPKKNLTAAKELLNLLFPGKDHTDWEPNHVRALRICHPDFFSTYFRLSLQDSALSRDELVNFISSISDVDKLKEILIAGNSVKIGRHTKSRILLTRLRSYVKDDIQQEFAHTLINILFDIGDILLERYEDMRPFDPRTESIIAILITDVLPKIDKNVRATILMNAIRNGKAIASQLTTIIYLEKKDKGQEPNDQITSHETIEILKLDWLNKIAELSKNSDLLSHNRFTVLLYNWCNIGNVDLVKEYVQRITHADEGLLRFLVSHISYARGISGGEKISQPRISLPSMRKYLDIDHCATRLGALQHDNKIPSWATEAVTQFKIEYQMVQDGKDPDAPWAFDPD